MKNNNEQPYHRENRSRGDRSANDPARDKMDIQDDFKMNVNDNPRANENVYNESLAEDDATSDVGSEITDGEAS